MTSPYIHNDTVYLNELWYRSHKDLIKKIARELDCPEKITELTEKFLGDPMKIKKQKDINRPKRPKSGFLRFCDEYRSKVKNDDPSLKFGGIMKELGKIWASYDDQAKDVYNIKYKEDLVNFEVNMDEYNLNNYYY